MQLHKLDIDWNRLAYEIMSGKRQKRAFVPPEAMPPEAGAEPGPPPEAAPAPADPSAMGPGPGTPPPPGPDPNAPAPPPGGGGLLPPEIQQTIVDTATQAAQQAVMAQGQGGQGKGPGAAKVTPEMMYQVMGRVLTVITALSENLGVQVPSAGIDDMQMQQVGMQATAQPPAAPGGPAAPAPAPGPEAVKMASVQYPRGYHLLDRKTAKARLLSEPSPSAPALRALLTPSAEPRT